VIAVGGCLRAGTLDNTAAINKGAKKPNAYGIVGDDSDHPSAIKCPCVPSSELDVCAAKGCGVRSSSYTCISATSQATPQITGNAAILLPMMKAKQEGIKFVQVNQCLRKLFRLGAWPLSLKKIAELSMSRS